MSENTIYIFPSTELLKEPSKVFKGLGKATKRGIRKCYKCGIYNGTRGIICKNKHCDAVFKDSGIKRNSSLDAVRLIAGNFRQVFSVRVRDTGPDYRGFVQLPVLHSNGEDTNIFSEVTLCFVDSCQRLFDDSILHCHENTLKNSSPLCIHIKSALQSKTLAVGLRIKKDVINAIRTSNEIKERLWILANTKEEAFVQRISKHVLAVNCQVTPKHPLGYLHFTFFPQKGKEISDSYMCSCTESTISASHEKSASCKKSKCLHYFACICALASHPKFSEEFQQFISPELPPKSIFCDLYYNTHFNSSQSGIKNNYFVELYKHELTKSRSWIYTKNKHKLKKIIPKIFPLEIKVLDSGIENTLCDNTNQEPVWTFTDWLSYITESINNTMVLENCETVTTLSFYMPKLFYKKLFNRIVEILHQEKNSIFFENKFKIDDDIHLKQIFDNPKVKLKTSELLVQDNLNCLEFDGTNRSSKYMIQFDLGLSSVRTESVFLIEWLPNVLNLSEVGQLKLQYKFIVNHV